jgi:4-hydroxybutyrate dehydrogenase
MSISTFSFPTRVLFGVGAIQRLTEEAAEAGMKRPLVVTDRGLVSTPMFQSIVELLPGAPVFSDVDPNPTEMNILNGAEFYLQQCCDGIVGVGGGSALDAAKAIRLITTHELPLAGYDDLIDGGRKITADLPPFIAVATTSGTGSEVGRSTVITIQQTNRKTVIFSPYLIASPVIDDPALTLDLPPHITAGTGMDAFTHNVEAYLANGYHPLCDSIAIAGAALVVHNLPDVMIDPHDIAARTNMMMASMMGAIAFQKGLGATHSLAHPLSSECNMHHGTANAVLLPHVLEFNHKVASERLNDLARAFGVSDTIDHVRELNTICAIKPRLRDYGIMEEALPMLAGKAILDGCHQSNPRPCTREDLLELYRKSW